jgi:predicted nucleic acid-binding Zn ribbon protein
MDSDNLEFKEISEPEEKLDYDNLAACPHCKKPIPQDSTLCLYCGQEVSSPDKKSSWVFWTAIALVIISILIAVVIF